MSAPEVRHSPWRRITATVLVVIASILAFLAILAIWVNRQALNTDNWTKTSTELLQQPVIRDRVAERLTDELFTSVDVEQAVANVLPPRAQVLAAPAANALRTQVEKQAKKALARPDVQQLWANANRTAHEQLLAVLNGGGSTVSTQQGVVTLNVSQLLAELQQQVGVGGRLRKVLPASASTITLFQANQLKAAQNGVKILRPLPVILLLVAIGFVAIAIAIAPTWRRRAVRGFGFGLVIAGLGALLVRSVAGGAFVDSLAKTAAAEPAVKEVWTIATDMLGQIAVASIAYGVVLVLAAWLGGSMRPAVAVRRAIAPYYRSPAIAYSVLAVVVLVLVWWAPTPAWRYVAMVLILIGLLAAGTEALRRQVIREFPDATREDATQRNRERWERLVASTRRGGESVRGAASRTAQSATSTFSATKEAAAARFTASDAEDARLRQLERLAELRQAGVLDDAELRAEKARILQAAESDGVATAPGPPTSS
jgi:hypothetical protein